MSNGPFRFDQDVDRESSFKHSTVLAMPIKHAGSPGRVLGVFQLVNKFDNLPFTRYTSIHNDCWGGCWTNLTGSGGLYFPPQFVWYWGGSKGVAITQHKSNAIRSASQVFLEFPLSLETQCIRCILTHKFSSSISWTHFNCDVFDSNFEWQMGTNCL